MITTIADVDGNEHLHNVRIVAYFPFYFPYYFDSFQQTLGIFIHLINRFMFYIFIFYDMIFEPQCNKCLRQKSYKSILIMYI